MQVLLWALLPVRPVSPEVVQRTFARLKPEDVHVGVQARHRDACCCWICCLLQAMSLADRVQLAKLLRASTACDDVLLSVLAVARGPLFKADASEGKAAAAQPFLLSPSSRCSIGLCREEMQEDQRCAQPARPAPCQSGRPSCGVFNLEKLFPMSAGELGKMKRPSQFVCAFRLLALHQAQPSFGEGRPRVRGLPMHVLPRSVGLGLSSLRCRWLVLPVVASPGHRRPEASCVGLSGLGYAVAGPPPNTLNAGRRRAGSGEFRLRQ